MGFPDISKEFKKMNKMMRTTILALTAMICVASGSAMAQAGFGIRAGVTAGPNQFHFGPHYVSDPFLGNLTFRPNLEIGVGDHTTTLAANVEFAYGFPISNSDVSVYVGAGPALNAYWHNSDTNSGGGLNLLVGVEHKKGLFGEIKVGAFDSPDFKFTVGYTFR
jgi:hypothetical protein